MDQLFFAPAAHAAEAATTTTLDLGGAGSQLLLAFASIIAGTLTPLIMARLPGFAKLFVSDQSIRTAILVTISKTAGALAGQPVVHVETSNLLILGTLNALKAGWPGFMHWVVDRLEPYVIAQLQLMQAIPEAASAETLGADKAVKP